jgi:hypothetical protein
LKHFAVHKLSVGLWHFMHSIEYNYAPSYFENTWQKNSVRNPLLNLRNENDYYISHPRTETFKKSTLYALPTAWNNLSSAIKLQSNKTTFKWALKAHLIDEIPEV